MFAHAQRDLPKNVLLIQGLNITKTNSEGFYKEFSEDQSSADSGYAARLIGLDASYLYQSDQDFQYRRHSEEYFLKKTNYTLQKIEDLCSKFNITALFSVGGGSLFTNCFVEYFSKKPTVLVRRMPTLSYLTADSLSSRYLFLKSNSYVLSEETITRFDWAKTLATEYYDRVREAKQRPDQDARKSAMSGMFTPTSPSSALKYLIRYFGKKILGRKNTFEEILRIKTYISRVRLDIDRLLHKIDPPSKPFFLLILHDPTDSQLTFRGRHYTDQIAMARMIASNLPHGTELVIKEHPVYPGMIPYGEIRLMRDKYPKCTYLDYTYNITPFLKKCAALITINSTAGVEAMITGKPVIVLGDSFYSESSCCYRVRDLSRLTNTLAETLHSPKIPKRDEVIDLLADTISLSYPRSSQLKYDDLEVIKEGITTVLRENGLLGNES